MTTISGNTSINAAYIAAATWPIKITASCTITFTSGFTLSDNSNYFVVNAGINVIFNGQNNIILINTDSYPGLVQNTNNTSNVTFNYLTINAGASGILDGSGGWFCQNAFQNGTLNYCNSNSNGYITVGSGGIVGANALKCLTSSCFALGTIDYSSGGIYGPGASGCTATNCYSTGTIGGVTGSTSGYGGGIFAEDAISCVATNCYSTGNMLLYSGGIYGPNATLSSAYNCYSVGKGDGNSEGGIFAPNTLTTPTPNCNATACYTTGSYLSGDGIFATPAATNVKYSSYSEQYNTCGYKKIWQNKKANCVLKGVGTIWININPCSKHTPYLLGSYNSAIYNPAYSSTYCSNGSTNAGSVGSGSYYITRVNKKKYSKKFNINISTGQIFYKNIKCKKYCIGVVNGTFASLAANLPTITYMQNPCNPCKPNPCSNSNNNWSTSYNYYYTLTGYNFNAYQLSYCKQKCKSYCSSSSSSCSSSSSSSCLSSSSSCSSSSSDTCGKKKKKCKCKCKDKKKCKC